LAAAAGSQIRNREPRLAVYSGHSCNPIVAEHKTAKHAALHKRRPGRPPQATGLPHEETRAS
jgi:hypothetical protein